MFGSDSSRWEVLIYFDGGSYNVETYTTIKDTIVYGIIYKKIKSNFSGYEPVLLREDTSVGKVWFRNINSTIGCNNDSERLMMDLSLQIGDSTNEFSNNQYAKVDSVYYIAGRKHIRFNHVNFILQKRLSL